MDTNCQYCGAPLEADALNCAYCDSMVPGAQERIRAREEAEAARKAREAEAARERADAMTDAVGDTVRNVGTVLGASLLSGLFGRRGRTRYTAAPPPPPQGRMGGTRNSPHRNMGGPGGGFGGPGGGFGGPGGGRGPGGGMGGPGGRR